MFSLVYNLKNTEFFAVIRLSFQQPFRLEKNTVIIPPIVLVDER